MLVEAATLVRGSPRVVERELPVAAENKEKLARDEGMIERWDCTAEDARAGCPSGGPVVQKRRGGDDRCGDWVRRKRMREGGRLRLIPAQSRMQYGHPCW